MKKELLGKFLPGLLSGIIIMVVGIIINNKKTKSDNEVKRFDVWINTHHQAIDKTILEKEKIQILWDGRPIHGISDVQIELYNFTGKSFQNIPVYVELFPAEGDTLKLMKEEVFGTNELQEGISVLKDSLSHSKPGSLKFGYVIEVANQLDSLKPVFRANFPIVSKKEPRVKVLVKKDGLDASLQTYNHEHFDSINTPILRTDTALLIYFVLGYILLILAMVKIAGYFQIRRSKKLTVYLKIRFSELISNGNFKMDAEEVINKYDTYERQFNYEDASAFRKWLYRMKDPSK